MKNVITGVGGFVAALGIYAVAFNKAVDNRFAFNDDIDKAAAHLIRGNAHVGNPFITTDGRAIGYFGAVKGNIVTVPIYAEALPLHNRIDLWVGKLSCELQGRASAHGMIIYINRRSGWRRVEEDRYCAPLRFAFTQNSFTATIQP